MRSGDRGRGWPAPWPAESHPELDLALLDYFQPVPRRAFDAYAEVLPIDSGFRERRELWRLAAYLAVVEVAGHTLWGSQFLGRIEAAVRAYR